MRADRTQVWECPVCKQRQVCPIPAVQAECSHKHKHTKMVLIEGEAYEGKVKK